MLWLGDTWFGLLDDEGGCVVGELGCDVGAWLFPAGAEGLGGTVCATNACPYVSAIITQPRIASL